MKLIAESGSTKTDWVLLGSEVRHFQTLGLNPYFVNAQTVAEELKRFLTPETAAQVREVHFYGTGITDESKGNIIKEGVQKVTGHEASVFTFSDIIAAARSLFGDSPGIACILGTGSNSCFWDGQKVDFQIPPLGFWLGDEGSGGYLGKSLILAYLHKEIPLELRDIFDQKYGKKDRLEILNHAYQKEKPNRYFAQFSEFVGENIKNPFCAELVESGFRLFIEKYLLKYPQLKSVQVGAVGSIAWHFQNLLQETAKQFGLTFNHVVQKPIHKLIEYHQQKV